MIVIPAIDLKDGKCVRLTQGRADAVKVYADDPVAMARYWVGQGAEYLHVVDLDGAFEGRPVHTEVIGRVVEAIDIPVEVGGGLRTNGDIQALLDVGVHRAIIGTRAVTEPTALEKLAVTFGEGVAVGIDAREGMVQVKGWVETTHMKAVDLATEVARCGIKTIIYTDTARDGMLGGVNADAMATMCRAVKCAVVASGGVSSPEDIARLCTLRCPNLIGAIVGKALYEKNTSLEALQAAIP
jgi:phosphoribosylformimino-5-aminoimidazole carboxamide ribotide isomerase